MKASCTPALLVSSLLLLTVTAHAQLKFHVGPHAGINVSMAHFAPNSQFTTTSRTGLEAGLMGSLQVGHFALQPAVLYARQGFERHENYFDSGFGGFTEEHIRLDYVTIPLQLAFSQRKNGQGVQFFTGPYVGFLIGGRREAIFTAPSLGSQQVNGKVVATNVHTITVSTSSWAEADNSFYSRRTDAGLRGGIGYRLGGVLLQVSYSLESGPAQSGC